MTHPRSDLRSPPPQGGAPSGPAEPDPRRPLEGAEKLDERSLSKLRWRCRRGLLENDIFIDRFFRRYEETLTTRQAEGLLALMDLPDNDLLDLLLARKEPATELDLPEVREVLAQLRSRPN
jgi:antitoxin CptB